MLNSFHCAPIKNIETCISKSIIATSCKNNFVKVWDFIENTLTFSKHFEEEIQRLSCLTKSISLHPSGLYLVVVFSNSVILADILVDNIQIRVTLDLKGADLVFFIKQLVSFF